MTGVLCLKPVQHGFGDDKLAFSVCKVHSFQFHKLVVSPLES